MRTRRQFDRLAQPARRGRSGPVRVSFCEPADASESFAVAYAIPRRCGNAVARNLARRRLRVAMDELRPRLASGIYLIKCDFQAKELNYERLADLVEGALDNAGVLH